MTIETGNFENLTPSHFISFTIPNPFSTLTHYRDFLRVAVLDSPHQPLDPPKIAAMLVPINRENDWIFCTENGQAQLLSNFATISRLILVGNPLQEADSSPTIYNRSLQHDSTKLEKIFTPLIQALSPKSAFVNGLPEIPFLTYEDDVICSVTVDMRVGSLVGEMLVEDIEIGIERHDEPGLKREFRRRLRFKRMPNLVQTEIRIEPETIFDSESSGIGNVQFRPETSSLVHPYLPPMVAGLSLVASYLEELVCLGSRPRLLCVGVGGGALLSFLQTHFGFQIFGVESDEMVVRVAKEYFGLVENEFLGVCIGDGIDIIEKFGHRGKQRNGNSDSIDDVRIDANLGGSSWFRSPVDVIMVDLDASDAKNGSGAPPLEFIRKSVLVSAKLALGKIGILVVNVIPVSKEFYDCLIHEFREVFSELYEINVGNDENYVLIASVSEISPDLDGKENFVLKKLKITIPSKYMDSIRKI